MGRRIVVGLACLTLWPSTLSAATHRLEPRVGHPTFAVRAPVLTVKPGDVVESETLWGTVPGRPVTP